MMRQPKKSFAGRMRYFAKSIIIGSAIGALVGVVSRAELRGRPGRADENVPAVKTLLPRQTIGQATEIKKTQQKPVGFESKEKMAAAEKEPPTVKKAFPIADAKMSVILSENDACLPASFIDAELQRRGSPAAGLGEKFVKWGRHYGINPAVALAFFRMESLWGTAGIATKTKAIGNIRYTNWSGSGIKYENFKGFRKYASWEDGIKDFYWLLSSKNYAGGNRKTLEQIIQKYSPAAENNQRHTKKQL